MLHPQRSAPAPLSWDAGFADQAAFPGPCSDQWPARPALGWPESHQRSPSQSHSHSPYGAASRASSQPRSQPQSQPHSRPPSPHAGGVVNPWAQQHPQPQQQWPSRSCSPSGGPGPAHPQPHRQPQQQPQRSPTPPRSAPGFAPPTAQPYQQAVAPRSPRDAAAGFGAGGPPSRRHSAEAPAGFGGGTGAWAQPEQHHNPFRGDPAAAPPAGAQSQTPPPSPGGRYSSSFSPAYASGAHASGFSGTAGPCGYGGCFDGGCGGAGPGQPAWATGFEPVQRGHPAPRWGPHAHAGGASSGQFPAGGPGGASPHGPQPQQWCLQGGPAQQHPGACGGGCHGAVAPWPQGEAAHTPNGATAPGYHGGGAYWPQAEPAAPGGGGAVTYHGGGGAPPGGCWPPCGGQADAGWGGPAAGGWQSAGCGWPGGDETAVDGCDSTPSRSSKRKHKRDKHKADAGGEPQPPTPTGSSKSNMEILKELRVLGISSETGYRTADIVAAISQCEGSTPRAVKLLCSGPERRPPPTTPTPPAPAGAPDAWPRPPAEPSAAAVASRPPRVEEDRVSEAGLSASGRSGSTGAKRGSKLFSAGSWLQRRSSASKEAIPDDDGDKDVGRTGTESSGLSHDRARSQEGPKLMVTDDGPEERSPASRWDRARALVFRRRPSKEDDFMDRDEH